MNKLLSVLFLGLVLTGCGEGKVKYVDSKTGEVVVPPKSSMEVLNPEVFCIGNVQYYKIYFGHGVGLSPRTTLGAGNNLVGFPCG